MAQTLDEYIIERLLLSVPICGSIIYNGILIWLDIQDIIKDWKSTVADNAETKTEDKKSKEKIGDVKPPENKHQTTVTFNDVSYIILEFEKTSVSERKLDFMNL